MRRILKDLAGYVREFWTSARSGWDAFFFTAADPTAVGLIRIAVGLLAFWSLLVFGLDLQDFFGSDGWASPDAIRLSPRSMTWSFWFFVPDHWLRLVWCVCLAVFLMFALGIFSRVTAVLAWVIVVSTVRRLPIALHGFDQILSTLAFYLAVTGASGQAVSLDRFFDRWRRARTSARKPAKLAGPSGRLVSPGEPGVPAASVTANLALRLIQVHMVVIYGMAAAAKLQGPSWWSGMALWGTMTAGEFVTLDFTPLAAWPRLINFLTHAALALELCYPILIWVRIMRPLVLAGLITLHLGIAIVSPGLTEFALVMLAGNLAFVSGSWLRRLATGVDQPALRILFDGGCPRCRATMALITAADPDRVLAPIDLTSIDVSTVHPSLTSADCLRAMHVVTGGERIRAGFDGVRSIASWLPLFWPAAAIGYVPGVAWLGRRVYNFIAATRPRDVACTDDLCGLHSPKARDSSSSRGRALEVESASAAASDRDGSRPS